MPDLTPIIDSVQMQRWYPLAGMLLTFAVQLVRKQPRLASWLWTWWPDGYRWVPVAIASGAVAFSVAFQGGAAIGDALQAALGGVLGIGTSAMGFAALLKESPIKWDGAKGGVVPPTDQSPPTPRTGTGGAS
jgi:hypothetical protein